MCIYFEVKYPACEYHQAGPLTRWNPESGGVSRFLSVPHTPRASNGSPDMSVPGWKQAILERRKKQEDDQKKKQAEEEAYLATLPPWKRALFQKRERERRQQEEKEKSAVAEACARSDSFQQRHKQLAHERENQQRAAAGRSGSWGRRATPPSAEGSDNEPTSPTSPSHGLAHTFFPTTVTSTQLPRVAGRRSSVTTLPGIDTPIAEKVANAPIPPSTWQSRRRSASESAALAAQKVVSNVKIFNEVKTQSTEMPAWKKALLQRRKEKEMKTGQRNTSSVPSPASAPVLNRRESPREDVNIHNDKHAVSEPSSSLTVRRMPSPAEECTTAVQEPSLHLQRKLSPKDVGFDSDHRSTPSPTSDVAPTSIQKADRESRPPGLGRKPSPVESVETEGTESPPGTKDKVTSIQKSHKNVGSVEKRPHQKNDDQKLVPKRTAPVAPTGTNTQQQKEALPLRQPNRVSSSRPQQKRPPPEVVNRAISEGAPQQSKVIQTEGITHRAPVYRELGEWTNVSEDDPKFRNLPTWKQALIKRRRADIAKRMGLTTSVDDVPLTNGPVLNNKKQGTVSNALSEDQAANIPPWKKQMIQRKAERGTSGQNTMSSYEKKHLANRRDSPTSSSSNVRALMDRFSPSPPPTTTPVVTIISPPRSPSPFSAPPTHDVTSTRSSRSPSPSSAPPTHPVASSRPAYISAGIPQPSPDTHTTRKSFTWTPGEDTIPGDALSDDSSEDDEAEHTITNIDDTTSSSSDEEGEGREESGDNSGVVLLRPPQTIVTPNANEGQKVRKTSSILINSDRPKNKVSS